MGKKMEVIGKIGEGTDVYGREVSEEYDEWMIDNEKFLVKALYPCRIKIVDKGLMDYGKIYNATRYDSDTQIYYLVYDSAGENYIYTFEEVEELEESKEEET